jgi:peroxiredoxin
MRPSFSHWLKLLGLGMGALFLTAAKEPKVGDVAPNFELTMIDGSKVTLDQLRGQVVVLNFWATWCVPCREELPLLDRYYDIQQKAGLKVFAIATEDSVPLSQLKKLFAVMHIPSAKRIKGGYPILKGVPTNYIIDRSGHIRYAKAGAFDLDALNSLLVPLLKEPVPAPAIAAN